MMKIILIHGNSGGTAEDYWFPYVKKELENSELTIIAKTFPDNDFAREKYWMPFLKDELKADEHSILLGWSSGGTLAMRFAEKNKLFGSVLVSASYTDLGDEKEKKSGYFNRPWYWDRIRKNQQWVVQFASTDDPYIPIVESRYIHRKLQTEYYEYTD
ncbi:alpha/beta hydrolase, partial [Candidatus Roizmanbacteria bacterium]|nr:alpha/beta hydrolase [Candidatus Roizmanbacteria bacterium]